MLRSRCQIHRGAGDMGKGSEQKCILCIFEVKILSVVISKHHVTASKCF